MIPERFVTEYPSRCMDLFELMEPIARDKELVGSFSLIVATSIFLIPYERMKARHPLNRGDQGPEIYSAIRRVERQRFLEAEFWRADRPQPWRLSRIVNEVERTDNWHDEQGRHPMAADAENRIERKTVGEVLRVIRNALAHGNVIYLDEHGFESRGAQLNYLAFLSRYEETEEQQKERETYRFVATTEDGFLEFVKSWAAWLAALPADSRISEAAERGT